MWNRVVVMDGAMGTRIEGAAKDSLNVTAPDTIRAIHRAYLEAGADILKTNTFNAGFAREGARIARAMANEFTAADPSQPRFVAGVLGPAVPFYEHAKSLVEGGVDILLAETITSITVAQAAVAAFEKLFSESGRELPIMLSVTIRKDGTLLSGETLTDFWRAVSTRKLLSVGINCSQGARHIGPFIEALSNIASIPVSCHPSAGLPNAEGGYGGYDEGPEETAEILRGFALRGWVDIVGGCCGTTPLHTRAIVGSVRAIPRVTIGPL